VEEGLNKKIKKKEGKNGAINEELGLYKKHDLLAYLYILSSLLFH